MAMPTEASIYCSKCAIYNISPDNCFCDDCLQEIKEKYLDEFCRFCCFEQSKTTIKLNLGHLRELFREYKTNKEEVGE